jgi:hypothetical protein
MIRVVARYWTLGEDCPIELPIELIFMDGYETGDTSEWSGAAP